MSKVFLPSYNSNNCAFIYSSDIIRVLDSQPTHNSNINYTDYYIKSSYISNRGQVNYGQYSTLPTCINSNNITNNVFYRNDIDKILVIFLILLIFCFYFPYRLISRMFGRWLKI